LEQRLQYINPENEQELVNFYRDWRSNYPDVTRGKGKDKKTTPGLKPPSIVTMRILFQYATYGDIPGEFLMSMLTNMLYETFNTSPIEEISLIPSTVQYITIYLPTESWGSVEKYSKWINNKKKNKIGKPTDFY